MVKNFLKMNQTRYRLSHVYLEYTTKKNFDLACVEKS